MDSEKMTDRFEVDLELHSPPIAIAFVPRPPDGIDEFNGAAPSACSMWRSAESGPFYAPASSHGHCSVGAMVMGFDSVELQGDLSASVEKMVATSYLSPEEPANIPAVKKKSSGIVYGTLRGFPLEPDVILMWLSPIQAMLFGEAGGNVAWSNPSASVLGRPACAAIPLALESGRAQLSLGCIGMRTYTEVSDDRLLAVLPGASASTFAESLREKKEANAQMAAFYRERKRLTLDEVS